MELKIFRTSIKDMEEIRLQNLLKQILYNGKTNSRNIYRKSKG